MFIQPWVSNENPIGRVWLNEVRRMLADGALKISQLETEVALGHFRPSILTEVRLNADLSVPDPDRFAMLQAIDAKAGFVKHAAVYQKKRERKKALEAYEARLDEIDTQVFLLDARQGVNTSVLELMTQNLGETRRLDRAIAEARQDQLEARQDAALMQQITNAAVEALPKLGGVFAIDLFSPVRGALFLADLIGGEIFARNAIDADVRELRRQQDIAELESEQQITITGWEQAYDIQVEIAGITQLIRALPGMRIELYTLAEAVNQATGRYTSAAGRGLRNSATLGPAC
jgi:hypothetical protein